MGMELRKTGINVGGDLPWGAHFCYFYETKQDLLDTLVPYFKAGLENNECCLWVVSDSDLITVDEAKEALAQAVPDLDRHLSAESIEILNGHHWYFDKNVLNFERVKSGWDAKVKRALARGYDGLRASADTFWLAEKEWEDFFAYEKQINDWITDQTMTVVCTYPLRKSGAAEVLDVVEAHQFAIARRQGEWEVIQSPEPMQAKAEIKRLNEELQRVKERTPQPPAILRYGVAVLSVIVAVITLLLMDTDLQAAAHVSLFLCAVIFSTWFGGIRPGLLAIVLSILAFAYVLPPSHSLAVGITHLPRLILFALLAFFVASLTAAQQSKAASLRRARDVLDGTVQDLKRTNVALRTENAERKRAEDALRRSEDRIRLIIDTIPTMAWTVRPDGVIDFVNQRWLDYTGLSLEEEIEEPTRPIHPEDLSRAMKEWAADMAAEKPSESEIRLRRADGKYRWFLVRTVPLRDESGKIAKWYGVSTDIDDRKRAEEQLRVTSEQLRALSARLQSAREEEGARIAREIHDELGSMLTGLKWDLEEVSRTLSITIDQSQLAVMQEKLRALIKLTDTTVNTLRRIASELRPSVLDDLGLAPAIEWQTQQFQARTGIVCHCELSQENIELSAEQSTAVFRIFQETLTNVLRHARATRIDIKIEIEDGFFVLSVKDNGIGISQSAKSEQQSLGLLGMRERAHLIGGEVNITSAEGQGTVVTLRVPIPGREIARRMTR